MKGNRYTSAIIAAALGFCASFGATACVATGLELSVDLWLLLIGCLLMGGIMATFFSFRNGGWVLLGLSALTLGVLIPTDVFMEPLLGICHQAADFYSQAYGFPLPEALQNAASYDHTLPLLVVAGLIDFAVTWTVIRRFPPALAVFLTILPLISCFVVTDTVPALLYLLIWIFAIAMLILTQPVRLRSARSANRLTVFLAFPVALGLFLLMVAIPQEGFEPPVTLDSFQSTLDWIGSRIPFIGQSSDGKLVINFVTDFPEEVDLEELDDRYTGTATVLEVTADHDGQIYLRAKDYDRYTGDGWDSSERWELFSAPHISLLGQQSHITVRVLGNRTQMLIPYYPAGNVELKNGILSTDSSDRNYSFDTVALAEDWVDQWRSGVSFSTDSADSRYLELPTATAQGAEAILSEIIGLSTSDTYLSAQLIGRYVRRSAVYSLKVDKMPTGGDFALWFLTEAEEGYCVHFATAATVLLRAQGIPARFVEGYSFYAEAGEVTEVRQDHAHAWVEYFVEGVGWVVLDPTPADGENTPDPTTKPATRPTEPDITQPTTKPVTKPSINLELPIATAPATKPTESTVTTSTTVDAGTDEGSSAIIGSGDRPGQDSPEEELPIWIVNLLIGLVICASVPAIVFGQWLLRRYWKLQRIRSGRPNRRVIACYQETRRVCRVLKTEVPAPLVALAEKAAYSQHTLTPEELAAAIAAYRACLQPMHKGRWYQKLIWRFLLALY